MKLRNLENQDAKYMYEWMHDAFVVENLNTDFMSKKIEDCYLFIAMSNKSENNIHKAIVDDDNQYQGTISLKNIIEKNNAEFAITIRKCAMGKGVSKVAMDLIVSYAKEIGLKFIYWYVSPKNIRAIKFYDKHGYVKTSYDFISKDINIDIKNKDEYIWYMIDLMS